MIVQFFRYGAGSSKGPLDYLLGKDRNRNDARILSGNEREIADLIDSSPYEKKYTSGCLSFYETDLTNEQKTQIMNAFEHALFPGMAQNQYRVLWIEHRDKLNKKTGEKRLELNFLIPNVEITTAKRLQPYYDRADRPRIDLFKKIINHQYRLHDPDDPLHQQATTTAKDLPKAVKQIKQTIDIEAMRAIEHGFITDRHSMKTWLIALGLNISRETDKFLSIKHPHDATARPIRLTGAIYEQPFRATPTSQQTIGEASARYRGETGQRHQSNLREYERYLGYRSKALQKQYRHSIGGYKTAPEHHHTKAETPNRRNNSLTAHTSPTTHQQPITAKPPTTSNTTSRSTAIEHIKPIHPQHIQTQKDPFHSEPHTDFNQLYSAYQLHQSRLHQLEQIQRHSSNAEQSSIPEKPRWKPEPHEMRIGERLEMVRANRPDSTTLHKQHAHRAGNQLGENNEYPLRNRTAEHYRKTTATTGERLAKIGTTSNDYQSDAGLHSKIRELQQENDRTQHPTQCDHSGNTGAEIFRTIIDGIGEQIKTTVSAQFDALDLRYQHSEPSQDRNQQTTTTTPPTTFEPASLSPNPTTATCQLDTDTLRTALNALKQKTTMNHKQTKDTDLGMSW